MSKKRKPPSERGNTGDGIRRLAHWVALYRKQWQSAYRVSVNHGLSDVVIVSTPYNDDHSEEPEQFSFLPRTERNYLYNKIPGLKPGLDEPAKPGRFYCVATKAGGRCEGTYLAEIMIAAPDTKLPPVTSGLMFDRNPRQSSKPVQPTTPQPGAHDHNLRPTIYEQTPTGDKVDACKVAGVDKYAISAGFDKAIEFYRLSGAIYKIWGEYLGSKFPGNSNDDCVIVLVDLSTTEDQAAVCQSKGYTDEEVAKFVKQFSDLGVRPYAIGITSDSIIDRLMAKFVDGPGKQAVFDQINDVMARCRANPSGMIPVIGYSDSSEFRYVVSSGIPCVDFESLKRLN